MRTLPIILLQCAAAMAVGCPACEGVIPDPARIADAIYLAEGGARARAPYGILSVPVRDYAHARQIAKNTVRNQWVRWTLAGRPGCYLDSLADRYCPPAHDPQGNLNWRRNVRLLLGEDGVDSGRRLPAAASFPRRFSV